MAVLLKAQYAAECRTCEADNQKKTEQVFFWRGDATKRERKTDENGNAMAVLLKAQYAAECRACEADNQKKTEQVFFWRGDATKRERKTDKNSNTMAVLLKAKFAATRGRNGFDGDSEAREAGSGGEPLITLQL
jgi:hypothetical protein